MIPVSCSIKKHKPLKKGLFLYLVYLDEVFLQFSVYSCVFLLGWFGLLDELGEPVGFLHTLIKFPVL